MGAAQAGPSQPPPPAGLAQMIPVLLCDVVLPIVVYFVLSARGVPTLWALLLGGVFPALNNLRIWVRSRRLEPLGIIVLGFLAVGTAASLISGSIVFALIKESLLTGSFGIICLASLLFARPLMFYVNRQFVAGDDAERLAWWNGLWQHDDFRAALRFVTAVWGIAYLIEALVRVALALLFNPGLVVIASPVLAFGMLLGLIVWNRRYMEALRARRLRPPAA